MSLSGATSKEGKTDFRYKWVVATSDALDD